MMVNRWLSLGVFLVVFTLSSQIVHAEIIESKVKCIFDSVVNKEYCEVELEFKNMILDSKYKNDLGSFMTKKEAFRLGKTITNTIEFDEFEWEEDKVKISGWILPSTQNYFGIEDLWNSTWWNSTWGMREWLIINSTDTIDFPSWVVPVFFDNLTISSGNITQELICVNETNDTLILEIMESGCGEVYCNATAYLYLEQGRPSATDVNVWCYHNNTNPPVVAYDNLVDCSDSVYNATTYSGNFYDIGGIMDELMINTNEHFKSYGIGGTHIFSGDVGGNSYYFGDEVIGEVDDNCIEYYDGNIICIINCYAGEDNTNQSFILYPTYFYRTIWGDEIFGIFDYISTAYFDDTMMLDVGGVNVTDNTAGDENHALTEPLVSWGNTANTESLTVVYNDTQYSGGKARTRINLGGGDSRLAITWCSDSVDNDYCNADSWLYMAYFPREDVDQSYQLNREYLRRFENPLEVFINGTELYTPPAEPEPPLLLTNITIIEYSCIGNYSAVNTTINNDSVVVYTVCDYGCNEDNLWITILDNEPSFCNPNPLGELILFVVFIVVVIYVVRKIKGSK